MAIQNSGMSYKVWACPSPKANLLLVHGLGASPSWWEPFASESLKNNLSSYAIDLRAHRSFTEFFGSINNLIVKIRTDSPGKKIFAVGESMGALVILSMALKDRALFDGLVCIAPAFNSRAAFKLKDYFRILLPLLYDRNKKCPLPLTPNMCTRDPVYLKIVESTYDRDDLSVSQVLFDMFIAQLRMRLPGMRIDTPLIFLIPGQDLIIYSESSVKIFGGLRCKDKTLIEYPGMYHSLSIELGREKVFSDIFKWIEKRL